MKNTTIRGLVVRARQLASVAQLVRALHRNRRAAGSIPARDLKLHFSRLFLVRSNLHSIIAIHNNLQPFEFRVLILKLEYL